MLHRAMIAGDTGKSPSELVRPFRGKNIATAFVLGGAILSICTAPEVVVLKLDSYITCITVDTCLFRSIYIEQLASNST